MIKAGRRFKSIKPPKRKGKSRRIDQQMAPAYDLDHKSEGTTSYQVHRSGLAPHNSNSSRKRSSVRRSPRRETRLPTRKTTTS